MKRFSARSLVIPVLAAMVLTAGALALQEQGQEQEQAKAKETKETFGGNVVMWTGPLAGQTTRLTLTVTHWITEEEKAELLKVLNEGGSDALLKAMRKKKAGYLRTTRSISYDFSLASSRQTEKGRLIRIVTDRAITFIEQMAMTPRSREYEFGVIEFTLDEKGKGDGYLIPAAKVMINKNGEIEVETLGTGPQKFLNVKKTK